MANNGGLNTTMICLYGSPAKDAAGVTAALPTNQRGLPRPYGAAADIGAVEWTHPVDSPLQIIQQPANCQVSEGSATDFSVAVAGEAPAYQWRFNGYNLAGASSSSYAISSAQPSQAGSYNVVITNSFGAVTGQVAGLTVVLSPVISRSATERNELSGSQRELQRGGCRVATAVLPMAAERHQPRGWRTNQWLGEHESHGSATCKWRTPGIPIPCWSPMPTEARTARLRS